MPTYVKGFITNDLQDPNKQYDFEALANKPVQSTYNTIIDTYFNETHIDPDPTHQKYPLTGEEKTKIDSLTITNGIIDVSNLPEDSKLMKVLPNITQSTQIEPNLIYIVTDGTSGEITKGIWHSSSTAAGYQDLTEVSNLLHLSSAPDSVTTAAPSSVIGSLNTHKADQTNPHHVTAKQTYLTVDGATFQPVSRTSTDVTNNIYLRYTDIPNRITNINGQTIRYTLYFNYRGKKLSTELASYTHVDDTTRTNPQPQTSCTGFTYYQTDLGTYVYDDGTADIDEVVHWEALPNTYDTILQLETDVGSPDTGYIELKNANISDSIKTVNNRQPDSNNPTNITVRAEDLTGLILSVNNQVPEGSSHDIVLETVSDSYIESLF